jgi:hypothetical protein
MNIMTKIPFQYVMRFNMQLQVAEWTCFIEPYSTDTRLIAWEGPKCANWLHRVVDMDVSRDVQGRRGLQTRGAGCRTKPYRLLPERLSDIISIG